MTDAHPLIGVAIPGPTNAEALRAYESIAGRAGIVELRLDLFTESPDTARLIRERPCPVVVTCRAREEGGRWFGTEAERLEQLRNAAALGAEYVDVERFAYSALGPVAPTRVIVSQHDFVSMPADLPERWSDIKDTGADVVKLAGMAQTTDDLLPVLDLLAAADHPTIAMAMGEAGLASRVLALRYSRCVLTYASISETSGTAPGQITLDAMLDSYHAATINEATAVYGLISPLLDADLVARFNFLLHHYGAGAVCVPLTGPCSAGLLRRLERHGFKGFHVQALERQPLRAELDSIDATLSELEGVSSITLTNGRLHGSRARGIEDQVQRWVESPAAEPK